MCRGLVHILRCWIPCQKAKSALINFQARLVSSSQQLGRHHDTGSKGTTAGFVQAQPTCAGFWLIRPFIWDRMSYSCLRLMPARVEVMGSGAPPGPAGAAPPTSPDTACAALAAVPTPTGCAAQAPALHAGWAAACLAMQQICALQI